MTQASRYGMVADFSELGQKGVYDSGDDDYRPEVGEDGDFQLRDGMSDFNALMGREVSTASSRSRASERQ